MFNKALMRFDSSANNESPKSNLSTPVASV